MENQFEQIREQQKASWNKFSSGWQKWDDKMMDFMKPMGDKIIELLHLKQTDRVLDIATGTGEPGLTIATIVKNGHVTLTDLSDDMLEIAKTNDAKKGLGNVDFLACDVCALPFPDASFDAVSCRLGFMFFPDMALAANEMFRVLKPGGKVVTTVWDAADKNFWVTAMSSVIAKNIPSPPPPAGAPGMFRCAVQGTVEELFDQAGSKNTTAQQVSVKLNCGTAETYWTMMTEVAAPFVAALSKADDATREKIKSEVLERINQKYPDGNVIIDGSAWVICAEK